MKKKNNYLDIVAVTLFLVLLFIPLLTFHREEGRISILENRGTAKRPITSNYSLLDARFTADWNSYLSDNIGTKDGFVLAYIAAMYRLFGQIEVPNYIVGKEGHIFFMAGSSMPQYQGLDRVNSEQMRMLQEKFDSAYDAMHACGTRFIFMPIPNPEELYGEYMPDSIHVISPDSLIHSIKEELINEGLVVVDVEKALKAHKDNEELLYYRNYDPTHWNDYGAFWGYQELMKSIQMFDSDIHFFTREEVIINREAASALTFLSSHEIVKKAFSNMSDWKYSVMPLEGWSAVEDAEIPKGVDPAGLSEWYSYSHFHNDKVPGNKKMILIGDSYVNAFLRPLLAESFTDFYFVHSSNSQQTIAEMLAVVKPEFVAYEVVERMADYNELARMADLLCASATDSMAVDFVPLD